MVGHDGYPAKDLTGGSGYKGDSYKGRLLKGNEIGRKMIEFLTCS